MKIIDVNLTVGIADSVGREIDLYYLLNLMEDYRIDHGVCFHQHALLDPKDGNTKMAALSKESNGRLSVCAVLDPVLGADCLPGEGTLQERLIAFRPACLRVFSELCRIPFHAFYWEEILEAANALALPLIVDCEYTAEFLCNIPSVCEQYPNVKFVLVRMGLCHSRQIFPLLQKRRNVYFTVERMTDAMQIEEINEKCGCDRLLFGSGYPERPHTGALGLVMYADIPQENRDKILYKNWEEFNNDHS